MRKVISGLFLLIGFCQQSAAQSDSLLVILTNELTREVEEFKKTELPPYFISYKVNEMTFGEISSSFGSLISSNSNTNRFLTCDVRVGNYELDNTHPGENNAWGMQEGRGGFGSLPIDNSEEAVSYFLWLTTQNAYRNARDRYRELKNTVTKQKQQEADFSKEKPSVYFEAPVSNTTFDKIQWEEKLRRLSRLFQPHADIVEGALSLQLMNDREYLVTTEGTSVVQNSNHVYLHINGSVRSKDGDIVPLHRSFFAFSVDKLPAEEILAAEVESMIAKLKELQLAPLAEPYTGPAILSAQAAGVFFHEIFGHRIEGHRLRDDMDGQTFKDKINQLVLDKSLNVVFDPTLTDYKGFALNGYFKYDDEGVPAQKVQVVQNGILKTFLMSRRPMADLTQSNGHGRATGGAHAVSRQSNLIVQSTKPVSDQELRKRLIQECKKQKRSYGYFFKDVIGGFTTTDRYSPNAFNIFPTEVYRVYVDGRKDELVRGVDLIGTPLTMFAEIKVAGDQPGLFTGFCGAESGSVPVSAVSPALFVRRIETQKKVQLDIESTLLKSPVITNE